MSPDPEPPDKKRAHRAPRASSSPASDRARTAGAEAVLVATHPEAVLRLIGDRIVDANAAAAKLFEQDREGLVGEHLLDLTPPYAPDGRSTPDIWADHLDRASRGIAAVPWRCLRPDGTLVEAELTLTVVATHAPEKAPEAAAPQIESLAVLVARAREVEPAWRSIVQLADAMAHDLNNQLAAIDGHLELAHAAPSSGEDLETRLAKARRAVRSAEAILLRFEAISHAASEATDRLDLAELLGGVRHKARLRRPGGSRIDVRAEEGLPAVEGVRGLLERVLDDLVFELAASPGSDGDVTITARAIDHDAAYVAEHRGAAPGRHVRVEVSGRGPVASAEVRAHLFDPRIARRSRFREVGPALAMTCAVVKQHRGYISAVEGPGGTGVVSIDLPVARNAAASTENDERATKLPERAGRSILLVEDEVAVRGLAASYLRDQGYDVVECSTAEEALELFERRPEGIDLLLADLKLPGMGGLALSQRVHKTRPDLKVLFTTGLDVEDVPDATAEAGERGLLTKPYRLAELGARVGELIGG